MIKINKKVKYIALLVTSLTLIITYNINHRNNEKVNQNRLETYMKCLYENYGQRDYCARLQGEHYLILDQLAESNGYRFEITESNDLRIIIEK